MRRSSQSPNATHEISCISRRYIIYMYVLVHIYGALPLHRGGAAGMCVGAWAGEMYVQPYLRMCRWHIASRRIWEGSLLLDVILILNPDAPFARLSVCPSVNGELISYSRLHIHIHINQPPPHLRIHPTAGNLHISRIPLGSFPDKAGWLAGWDGYYILCGY